MTAVATVTIDRSSLSLSDLVIDSEGFGTYLLDVDGLGRVGRTPRITYAAVSPYVNGQLPVAAVWDESTLSITVRIQSDSSADLDTAVAALEAALGQFSYTVTLDVNGVTKTYPATFATWNSTDALTQFARVMTYHEDLAITIPVYPVAS